MPTNISIGANPSGEVYVGGQNDIAGIALNSWTPAGDKRVSMPGTSLNGSAFGTGAVIVRINSTPSITGAVTQPTPIQVQNTQIDLQPLDMTGIADGDIYIMVEVSGVESNWLQDTKVAVSGSGALASQVSVIDSSGNQVINPKEGSGDLTSQVGILLGDGQAFVAPKTVTGSGDLAAQVGILSGTADNAIYQIGARVLLDSQAASFSGVGDKVSGLDSSGALQSQTASLTGVAVVQVVKTASGALVAQTGLISGVSNIAGAVTGSGALSSEIAFLSGAANQLNTKTGTGDLAAQVSGFAGAANVIGIISGNGAFQSQPATVISTAVSLRPQITIALPVQFVGPYTQGTPVTLSVAFLADSVAFTWSSDDPEYLNGNLSVELTLVDSEGSLPLGSMNAVSSPSFTLYDAKGADTVDRWLRFEAALVTGGATMLISGYDDLVTNIIPFAQDGGLLLAEIDLAA